MKRILILITAALFMRNAARAQQASTFRFHSINNVGLLEGGGDENLQVQTINGVQYKSFFGGIGIGLDNYYFKNIPLFVDLRKNLTAKKQTSFVYADFGASLPRDRRSGDAWSKSTFKTGLLYDFGLGYTIPIKGRFAVNVSAGYSEKFLKELREEARWTWIDFMPYVPSESYKDTSYYNYTFRRFSFKIGISF